MASHPFDVYFRRHGHYPRLRRDNGVQKIEVEFTPGYMRITASPRGGTIYITRSAWLNLFRALAPLTARWHRRSYQALDHDVPAAMHEAYEHDEVILREQRQMKKHRKRDPSVYQR